MRVSLHVEEHGPAGGGTPPPLVLTHGWVDDSGVWDGVVERLARRRRVITWDLRGHGRSEAPPPGNYAREDALDDLAQVVERAGTPCVLGGHSLGGYLSLAYALAHPEQVAGLVLVAAGPGFRNPSSMEAWNESVRASAAKLDLPPGQEQISLHTDSMVIDRLREITVPVLVVVGERDKRFLASASVFEKSLDVRATVVVPDAGHAVHRSEPGAVAEAIESFLAGL